MAIELPLDAGFLRRQCPNCDQQFKWHSGPAAGRPQDASEGPQYFCPLCGQAGAKDAFWTHEQLNYIGEAVMPDVHLEFQSEMSRIAQRSKHLSFEPGRVPNHPPSLHEPSDMVEVQPPCHPWEPVKIPEVWDSALYCLLCGTAYKV